MWSVSLGGIDRRVCSDGTIETRIVKTTAHRQWPLDAKRHFVSIYKRWRNAYILPSECDITDTDQDYLRVMVLANEFLYDLEQREVMTASEGANIDDDLLHLTLLSRKMSLPMRTRAVALQLRLFRFPGMPTPQNRASLRGF